MFFIICHVGLECENNQLEIIDHESDPYFKVKLCVHTKNAVLYPRTKVGDT